MSVMKYKKKAAIAVVLVVFLLLTACGQGGSSPSDTDGALKVVTSFTIIADLVREIGGEDVVVHNLVPTGTDPHEYEPLPVDIKKATDADVLFYNGLNLEGGKNGWFFKMIKTVGQKETHVVNLTERVTPMYIGGTDGHEEQVNPHAFTDPAVGIVMAEDLRDALVAFDPEHKAAYVQRAERYIARLREVDQKYLETIQAIPEDRRILVTSERAFQYMTAHYGLKEAYIWEIDTEENGSPKQIKALVQFVKDHSVPVLFIESNVDPRPMEIVAKETGVRIADKRIYSDEIGKPGDEVDTYIKYLEYNIALIGEQLGE